MTDKIELQAPPKEYGKMPSDYDFNTKGEIIFILNGNKKIKIGMIIKKTIY